jgi:hypothetical protein
VIISKTIFAFSNSDESLKSHPTPHVSLSILKKKLSAIERLMPPHTTLLSPNSLPHCRLCSSSLTESERFPRTRRSFAPHSLSPPLFTIALQLILTSHLSPLEPSTFVLRALRPTTEGLLFVSLLSLLQQGMGLVVDRCEHANQSFIFLLLKHEALKREE